MGWGEAWADMVAPPDASVLQGVLQVLSHNGVVIIFCHSELQKQDMLKGGSRSPAKICDASSALANTSTTTNTTTTGDALPFAAQMTTTDMGTPSQRGIMRTIGHYYPTRDIGDGYTVDPRKDLIPVCPNCHAMLHRRNPPLSIDELKELI